MKRTLLAVALLGGVASLSGCYDDGYGYGGYGGGIGYMDYGAPYAYNGWYDGYYGSIYDGYWGSDGYFWYRGNGRDHRYRRGDPGHFRHDAPQGQHNYRQFRGEMHPQRGYQMPNFRGGNPQGGPQGGGHQGGWHQGGGHQGGGHQGGGHRGH